MTEANASPPVPLDDQLCFSIYSAEIAIQRAYKPLLDGLGLTYPQYLVLNVLWREDA
ncbi:MAG TPA: MarR family transcriptional regulator, partial [Bosea sp. (in: a-proteobacteria)]